MERLEDAPTNELGDVINTTLCAKYSCEDHNRWGLRDGKNVRVEKVRGKILGKNTA